MNIIPAALIAVSALCGILGVDALRCYSCIDKSNNTECNQQPAVTCDASTTYCYTEVEKLITQKWKINKRCAQMNECNKESYNVLFMSKHTSCCSGDLCNEIANGTTNVKYNAFLILAAVLALSIFKNI
ncbi:lymphocyte antigen 6E-like [Eleutherodactylus coqui]|uniref:lymphocyte antigen 6E-like n=1 Tax=Eleutherodactylus coqui TaxID=57060 RepID=UPI003461EC24